jgi:SAM-dependent methyltransferase
VQEVSTTEYTWASAEAYERYVGRWSRATAAEFVRWVNTPPGQDWIDVGCGTGALTAAILASGAPRRILAVDLSADYLAAVREQVKDSRVEFRQADARALAEPGGSFDVAVSGLVLNFVSEPELALAEMRRVTSPGGTVAIYVWDYAGEMQLIRLFWDAAVELDSQAVEWDEGRLFPLCHPDALRGLFQRVGLEAVEVRAIDVPTRFKTFEDYWEPFLGGQGPAPGYVVSLDVTQRGELRTLLERRLPRQADGSIALRARAWAVRGRVPLGALVA